jgi:hypothetical protein
MAKRQSTMGKGAEGALIRLNNRPGRAESWRFDCGGLI